MNTAQLRTDLHKLVDLIEDERLLLVLRNFLRENGSRRPGTLWESLTEDQKNEVLVSSLEAFDDDNLVAASVVFKKLDENSTHKES